MEKEKLIITVSGRAMSGKSRLSFLLKKFLRENGFDVKHEVTLDYQNENDFDRKMMAKHQPIFAGLVCRIVVDKCCQLR